MNDAPTRSELGEPVDAPASGTSESEEDFVHEKVELPEWVPVAFGFILVAIALTAIWLA